jgi:single-stranded DNA-binding protein
MHSITGKLNNSANVFQAGESTGFGIRLGVKYRDPKTKADEYTNYSAVIFAKSPNQIEFYKKVLVEGSVVEVSAEQLKVNSYDGQNGTVLSIDMLNARLGYVFAPNQGAPQQQQQQNNQNNQNNQNYGAAMNNQQSQPAQGQQSNYNPNYDNANQGQQQAAPANNFDNFDSDIPF